MIIDYLSRPAPTRLTQWPGNREEKIFSDKTDLIVEEEPKRGKHLKKSLSVVVEGKEIYFHSRNEAADYLGVKHGTFNNCLKFMRLPKVDNLESIYYGDVCISVRPVNRRKKPLYIIDNGIRHEYESVGDASKKYGVGYSTLRKWLKRGSCNSRGITKVARI